jgi:hypothetical protein
MAKTLTDQDLADIVNLAVNSAVIDDADTYTLFVTDLAHLIADHFGGHVETTKAGGPGERWTVDFGVDECVPSDGGIFAGFDTGVTWKDWREE